MTTLCPAPIVASVLADIAHDWTMRQAKGDLALTPDETIVFARALRELAGAARRMNDTFQRIVAEHDALLAAASRPSQDEPPLYPGSTIVFAREQAAHRPGGAA